MTGVPFQKKNLTYPNSALFICPVHIKTLQRSYPSFCFPFFLIHSNYVSVLTIPCACCWQGSRWPPRRLTQRAPLGPHCGSAPHTHSTEFLHSPLLKSVPTSGFHDPACPTSSCLIGRLFHLLHWLCFLVSTPESWESHTSFFGHPLFSVYAWSWRSNASSTLF